MSFLTLNAVSCTAPDSTPLFPGLDLALGRETVGLVGRNGCGKSTLLEAIASGREPVSGTIARSGTIGLLRQAPDPEETLAEAIGLADELARIARIEAGKPEGDDLDCADWSLTARIEEALAACALPSLALARRLGTLSGGQRMRLMLAGLLVQQPDVLLLDEPSNNLDAEGRAALLRLMDDWQGGILLASHDRELLRHVDRIVELTPIGTHVSVGGWDSFAAARADRIERAETELERRKQELSRTRKGAQREREKQARSDSAGRKVAASGSQPKIVLNARRQQAEATAARKHKLGDGLIEAAEHQLRAAEEEVERLTPVRIELPRADVPSSHRLMEAQGLVCGRGTGQLAKGLDLTIRGGERIAVCGPNGSGKTSLLRILAGELERDAGMLKAETHRLGMLDQHLSMLSPEATALEEIRRHCPDLSKETAHGALAAYGFRNRWAQRVVGTLSGGERVRLALACLFSRTEPPWLLLLDEPTNHLDLEAIEVLEQALSKWDGAIVCVSHDPAFLEAIGVERRIELGD
ncbi:ABC-F family ATP-binding cassette domain-containing protein [Parerythrobacter aestuarii]|uniref:ABC-F family ATP-binding cassette domain-containing protein n=1 Tax=Parerythrobacter aestuarii TaxID=3020909 RepID=UPI0024DE0015|nr:ABC-F family ATP-binding cassette domain-containing protein [Parerythrobacter aestuarii]